MYSLTAKSPQMLQNEIMGRLNKAILKMFLTYNIKWGISTALVKRFRVGHKHDHNDHHHHGKEDGTIDKKPCHGHVN